MPYDYIDLGRAHREWQEKWDRRFMDVAKLVSEWSKDRSTKVGCVVVSPDRDILVTAYNGFPRGVLDCIDERHDRPAKYDFTEHADRNALFTAARLGRSLAGATMYIYGDNVQFPCADCARGIIQSGIKRLVTRTPNFDNPTWGKSCLTAQTMLREVAVEMQYRD